MCVKYRIFFHLLPSMKRFTSFSYFTIDIIISSSNSVSHNYISVEFILFYLFTNLFNNTSRFAIFHVDKCDWESSIAIRMLIVLICSGILHLLKLLWYSLHGVVLSCKAREHKFSKQIKKREHNSKIAIKILTFAA